MRAWVGLAVLLIAACSSEPGGGAPGEPGDRRDAAILEPIDADADFGGGSFQNACFSPDGQTLVVTVWDRYNDAPAYVGVVSSGIAVPITEGGSIASVNLPGSCWNGPTGRITYSSDEFDDEIFTNEPGGTDPVQVTDRPGFVAFEPSFSPDGQWIVFESHVLDVDGDGALFKVRSDGTQLTQLTDGTGDDRQPNWSPAGGLIAFQSQTRTAGGDWDVFVMDTNGGAIRNVTASTSSEDTDVSFSPDGRRLVFSSDSGGLELANLFVISTSGGPATRVTDADRYDGAPSWSPNGASIAFESYELGDPDGGAGTAIWTIAAP